MSNELNVLYQSDDNYAVYLGVSMLSLFLNNRDIPSINVYVIDDSISDKNRQKLIKCAAEYGRNLIFCPAAEIHEKAKGTGFDRYNGFRKNKMSYLKMFVADAVPKTVKRLLYIDCDTLVLDSLSALMETDMQGKPIGMVLSAMRGAKGKERVGLSPEDPYFNSGIILFDMDRWKEEKCLEQIIYHARNVRVYQTVDQDFYSVVLKGRVAVLDIKYNLQIQYIAFGNKCVKKHYPKSGYYYDDKEVEAAIARPAILHFLRFLGNYPMDENNIHPALPLFNEYLSISEFKDDEKKKTRLKPAIKIERIMYRILSHSLFLWFFKMASRKVTEKEEKKALEISRELREQAAAEKTEQK
ncbi:MAG: glycosyltransferase family 8 protein [Lachnospiraceae bacterium]|nr:glycosyltransferase family 8 protein [Lachnospiraceae bacterium]